MSEENNSIPFEDGPLPSADGTYPPKSGKRDPLRDPKTGQYYYVQRPAAIYASDAWRGMTPNARAILERVEVEYAGKPPQRRRNGELIVTYDDFEAHGIRRRSIPDAIERCEDLGFLVVRRGKGGKAGNKVERSAYGLTYVPWADATHAKPQSR